MELIRPLLHGLSITLKAFFKKPITLKYPEERWTPARRFRGLQRLKRDEKGKAKCVACCLCATVCPAQVIRVEAAEDEDHGKYPRLFELDIGRCIFCGYCEQACPVGAIEMTEGYELADYSKDRLIYGKERLLR
jgi:NADH-quinone oxidoreductase chain I